MKFQTIATSALAVALACAVGAPDALARGGPKGPKKTTTTTMRGPKKSPTTTARGGAATHGQKSRPAATTTAKGGGKTARATTTTTTTHGRSGTKPAKTTQTTTGKGQGNGRGTAPTRTATAGDTTTPTGTELTRWQQRLQTDTKFRERIQARLPVGADVDLAAQGFRNQGQFIAAVNVSNNLGISFDELKLRMTGPEAMSLGQAIQEVKGLDPVIATQTADAALAQADAETGTTTTTTTTKKGKRKNR